MKSYIALVRGINVGGHNKLPMKELRTELTNLGLEDVQTYIASGNVIFKTKETDPAELVNQISDTINNNFGFEPNILVLTEEDLTAAIEANPYPEATSEPKYLHFFFLLTTPENPDLAALEALKIDNERFHLTDRVFYLHAPDGIGRSKLAEKIDRHLGVATTARNYRTVSKIMEMLD